MVRLVRDKENKITVRVTATVDYSGFSATLSVAGIEKDIPNLKSRNIRLVFSPEEAGVIGVGMEGYLSVFDKNGELYVNNRVWFGAVDNAGDAIGYQDISIVLVSMKGYEGSIDPGTEEEIKKEVEKAVAAAMADIEKKIDEKVSLDYSDSHEEMKFFNGENPNDDDSTI